MIFVLFMLELASSNVGHIQVKCDPGVQIFLDGTFKGITKADVGGLIIQDVATGSHELKAVRTGYPTQTKALSLEKDQVFVHEFEWKTARMVIEETGEEADTAAVAEVGTLIIKSLPVECKIQIPRLNVDYDKTKEQLTLSGVVIGSYPMTFRGMGKTLSKTVELNTEDEITLFVNFLTGKIEISKRNLLQEKQEKAQKEKEARKTKEAEEEARRKAERKQKLDALRQQAKEVSHQKSQAVIHVTIKKGVPGLWPTETWSFYSTPSGGSCLGRWLNGDEKVETVILRVDPGKTSLFVEEVGETLVTSKKTYKRFKVVDANLEPGKHYYLVLKAPISGKPKFVSFN